MEEPIRGRTKKQTHERARAMDERPPGEVEVRWWVRVRCWDSTAAGRAPEGREAS
jgi:hypothetical protein